MTIKLSSGLRKAIVSDYGLAIMMRGGHIKIYGGGPQPDHPDLPPQGELRAVVTSDTLTVGVGSKPAGLDFIVNTDPGVLRDDSTWKIVGVKSGELEWWRFCWAGEDYGEWSDYYPRIDGEVGKSLLGVPGTITASAVVPVEFRLILPSY